MILFHAFILQVLIDDFCKLCDFTW